MSIICSRSSLAFLSFISFVLLSCAILLEFLVFLMVVVFATFLDFALFVAVSQSAGGRNDDLIVKTKQKLMLSVSIYTVR